MFSGTKHRDVALSAQTDHECVHATRFSLLWKPCIEALATALEHTGQQAWPLVLEQLTTAQASFLAGSSSAATADSSSGGQAHEPHSSAEPPQLMLELGKAMHSGDAEQSGGCTDAAVRLANMLKVSNSSCLDCTHDCTHFPCSILLLLPQRMIRPA